MIACRWCWGRRTSKPGSTARPRNVSAAQELLKPAPDDLLEAIEMHPQINDSRREEPGIQQPLQTQLLL